MALELLKNDRGGPVRDAIVINAAAGLFVAGFAKTIEDGMKLSDISLKSKRAFAVLEGLKRISRSS